MLDDSPVMKILLPLAQALARQREVLAAGALDRLGAVHAELESRFEALNAWPGGVATLQQAIAALPGQDFDSVRAVLQQAAEDNRVNGDLIRHSMNRVAAMQAFRAASSEAGTYGRSADLGGLDAQVSHRA